MTSTDRMILHWSPRSPFVRKVMIAAHELGLAGRIDCVRTVVGGTTANRELMRRIRSASSPRWCWRTAP